MEKQSLTEWERHTGSKGKNWKTSVRVKGSMLSLEQWVRVTLIFLLLILLSPVVCLSMLKCISFMEKSSFVY